MGAPEIVVVRVHDATGSHIEPPLDQNDSNLNKLRWHAAVVTVDCGREVRVVESDIKRRTLIGTWRRIPGQYLALYGNATAMIGDYASAWAWLNGFAAGAGAHS